MLLAAHSHLIGVLIAVTIGLFWHYHGYDALAIGVMVMLVDEGVAEIFLAHADYALVELLAD